MADMDTSRRRRKKWPEALKREIVSATLQPGVSVSVVARQYDVNANQVLLEQNDEWAASRARYMSPEKLAQLSDDPQARPKRIAAA